MPEISLPTKATQDAIKSDTTYIKGQFPLPPSGGIKRVQRGAVATASVVYKHVVTISPVDMTKSFVNVQVLSSDSTFTPPASASNLGFLASSTTLEIHTRSNSPNSTIRWEVIEFN